MSELILLGVIITLCALIGWRERENRLERAKMLNALMSKNATEMRDLEFVDKVKVPEVTSQPPDLLATADMTEDEFDRFIEEQNKNG